LGVRIPQGGLTTVFSLTLQTIMPNLLISAGPGCGKTHTLVDSYLFYRTSNPIMWLERFQNTEEQATIYEWCRSHLPKKDEKHQPAIYMAFNTEIVKELSKRVHKDCEVRTHHGWGYKVIQKHYGYVPVNEKAGEILVEKITGQSLAHNKNRFSWITTLRFVDKLKEELLDISEENFYLLQMKYSDLAPYKIHPDMAQQASQLIKATKTVDRRIGITYADQVWLSLFLLNTPWYPIGFVDECQDLSPARLALSYKLCENLVFCGDENQAINAFSGADPYSIQRIRELIDQEMTLKTSFRLPPNHSENANRIRPKAQVKSLPEKQPGKMERIDSKGTVEWAKNHLDHNPLVVCRYNAPLVKLALLLIKEQVPCKTLGDTLAKSLKSTVKNRNARDLDDLLIKLEKFEQRCLETGNDLAKQATTDKMDCIRYILRSCSTLSDFDSIVDQLLLPPKGAKFIKLSTVHKAKGLESTIVGVLNPPVPSDKAKTPVQKEQEINIDFVAQTRSKKDMFYIYGD
jgi:DNA helicase-2/ATP-dependent DNA helicase PcrA